MRDKARGEAGVSRLLLSCLLGLLLIACGPQPSEKKPMTQVPKLENLSDKLAFTCAHEADRMPKPDPELELLFKHARWLEKRNLLRNDRAKYPPIERLYRIAAAHGHIKAMNNLIVWILEGKSEADGNIDLVVDMTQDMIKQGIPQGYYIMGILLENDYGVTAEKGADLQYKRKAADLGSVDAQFTIGTRLESLGFANPVPYAVGKQMVRCAADQGHGMAAKSVAHTLHVLAEDGRETAFSTTVLTSAERAQAYADAVKYHQIAVKAGISQAAFTLQDAFLCTDPTDRLDYYALEKDEERSRRYAAISKILDGYEHLNATVDEIDEIVPLPPAKLPPWDGKIKWVEEWKKGEPPPLPSEERITELAIKKNLNPKTGLPVKVDLKTTSLRDPETGEKIHFDIETLKLVGRVLRAMRNAELGGTT